MATIAEEEAIKRLCANHYHQSLWLPATASHGKLRVTFATSRNFTNDSLPVVLFMPPMFGTRMLAVHLDQLAATAGVRLVCADRPGWGGSDQVPLASRVDIWLETVPVLLEKLKVKHVSLVSHSAGTLYLLNTLHKYRDILEPTAPYVALLAPWVEGANSKAALAGFLDILPSSVVGAWHGIASTFVKLAPASQWSSGVSAQVLGLFSPAAPVRPDERSLDAEKYGCDDDTAKEICKLCTKYLWLEETSALNDEALFCLGRGGMDSWRAAKDYERLVRDVAEHERGLQSPKQKLKVRAYFASSDVLIGKGGQAYFEKCWSQPGVDDVIDFVGAVKPDTNHDSVIADQRKGAMPEVLKHIGSMRK